MSTQIRWAADVIIHDNHVPPAFLTLRVLPGKVSNNIMMSNTSDATIMKVSFDGTNEFTILPGGVLTLQISNQQKYWTRGDALGVMEVLIGAEGTWAV